MDLPRRQSRLPAGQDGDLVAALVERSGDPVGPRVEFPGGRQDDHAALGHDLVRHGRPSVSDRPCRASRRRPPDAKVPALIRSIQPHRRSRLVHLFLLGAGHVGLVTAVGFAAPRPSGHGGRPRRRPDRRPANDGRPPVFEPGLTEAIAGGPRRTARWPSRPSSIRQPDARFTFVCVSTPTGPDGPLSTVNVEAAIARLLTGRGPTT